MASYTHYNIKFQRKDNRIITLEDYELLEELLFSIKHQGENGKQITTSWTGMFIFELCKKSNSVIFETTPIRRYFLIDALEYIRDKGEYTILTICSDEEGTDYLEIYDNRLKENYHTKCLYFYDEINIFYKKLSHLTEDWREYNLKKVKDMTYQYKKLGRYYSHNEIHDDRNKPRKNSLQDKCSLFERNSYILNNCDTGFPQSHHYVETNWYSDPFIWTFMASFEKGRFKEEIEGIEFKYKGELVRLYSRGIFEKCHMLDNWYNLDHGIFDNWKIGFEPKK